MEDLYAGLLGPIIVTRKGETSGDANGDDPQEALRPKDVDREFVIVMSNVDENRSPYLDSNIYEHIVKPSLGKIKPGWVPFAHMDKGRVLQALFKHAATKLESLSYAEARSE